MDKLGMIMEISVVTSNHGKFLEIKEILEKHNIRANHVDMEVKEEGATLEERCLSKARSAFFVLKKPLIVDDTGLFFMTFDSFPGAFPKKVFRELGYEGIFKQLEGKSRDASFVTLVCYIDRKMSKFFSGEIKCRVAEKVFEGGHESLPYDKIMIPEGFETPFCTLTRKGKNKISHRALATEEFAKWFSKA